MFNKHKDDLVEKLRPREETVREIEAELKVQHGEELDLSWEKPPPDYKDKKIIEG